MFKGSIQRVGGGRLFEGLRNKLNKIDAEYVEAGFFDSQGDHPTANMTFVDMIKIHEFGLDGVTARMPMAKIGDAAWGSFTMMSGKEISKYLNGNMSLDKLLGKIGRNVNDISYEVFGYSPPLVITSNETPLIDSGELSDAFSWKASTNSIIKSLPDRNKGRI